MVTSGHPGPSPMKRPLWFRAPNSLGEWLGLLGGALVLAALVALIAWNVVRLADGKVTVSDLACVDPTDPCNWSSYRVINDTDTPVVLRECLHQCGNGDRRLEPILVASKATTPNNGHQVTANVGGRSWWAVKTVSGQQIGCLVLDGHSSKRDGYLVLVSSARRCGSASVPTTPYQLPR
jgi:hypothetical protein